MPSSVSSIHVSFFKDKIYLLSPAKADVGAQLVGQQGYYHGEDCKFRLDRYKSIHRFSGPVDDTKTLYPEYRDLQPKSRPVESKKRRGDPEDRLDRFY